MADGAKPAVGTGAQAPGAHGGQIDLYEIPRAAVAAQDLGQKGVEVFEIPRDAVAASQVRANGGEIFEIPAAAIREQEELKKVGRLGTAAGAAAQGAGSVVSGTMKGAALLSAPPSSVFENMDRIDAGKSVVPDIPFVMDPMLAATPDDPWKPQLDEYTKAGPEDRKKIRARMEGLVHEATKSSLYKAGQDFDSWVVENAPKNPEFEEEWLSSKIPGAFGSMAAFAGAALLTRGALAPVGGGAAAGYAAPAALGAMSNSAQQFEESLQKGSDIGTALKASELGSLIGTTEAVPIGNMLNRLDKATGGAIKKYLIRVAKEGTEEAIQEASTSIMNAAVAQKLYDPQRGVWTSEVAEDAALGAISGALMETLLTLASPGRRRGRTATEGGPEVAPTPEGAAPVPRPAGGDTSLDDAFGTVEEGGPPDVESAPQIASPAAPSTPAPDSSVGEVAEAGAVSPPEAAPAEPDPFSPEETQRQDDLRTAASYIVPPPDENGRGVVPDPEVFPTHADMERARSELPKRIGIPGHPAWASRPDRNMKPQAAAEAVQKAQRGEALTAREQRFVDHMLEYVAEERAYQQDVPTERQATDDDYRNALLEESDRKLGMLAQRALELGADRDAVDLALESQSDELATEQLNGLIEKARADQKAPAAAGEAGRTAAQKAGSRKATDYSVDTEDDGQFTVNVLRSEDGSVAIFDNREGARTVEYPAAFAADKTDEQLLAYSFEPIGYRSAKATARPTDLFGADTERQAQLNAQNAKVASKLGDGRRAPPPGGMFAAADEKDAAAARAAQTDVEELQPAGKQTIHRGLPAGADPNQPGPDGLMFFSDREDGEGGAAEYGEEVTSREVDLTPENTKRYANRAALLADNGVDPKGEGASDPSALYEAARNHFAKPGAKPWLQFGYPELDGNPQEFIHKPPDGGIDAAAHQAATSPQNELPEPTEAQAKAGNYRKGHINKHGLSWTIENPAGSVRPFTRPDGTKGERTMQDHYGYIRGTEGKDGDHIDAFFGPRFEAPSPHVLAINQINPETGAFDEVKLMVGYWDADQALEAYYRNYQPGWRGVGSVVETDMERVKGWLEEGYQGGKFPKSRGDAQEVGQNWIERPGSVAAVEEAIRDDHSDAWPIQAGKTIPEFEADLKAAGWKRDMRTKGKHNWMKGDATLFLFSQGDLAGPIVQFKAGDLDAVDLEDIAPGKNPVKTQTKPSRSAQFENYRKYIEGEKPERLRQFTGTREQMQVDERLEDGEAKELLAMWDEKAKPKPDKAKLVPQRTEGGGVKWTAEPVAKPHHMVGKNVSFRGPGGKTHHGKVEKVENDQATVILDGQGDAQFKAGMQVPVTRLRVLFLQDDMTPPDTRGAAPTTESAPVSSSPVSANTIFTEDAAAKAREILRKKLGQLNTGLDPEMMQAGITLAGYHIEKGARTFAAYSKAMLEDLGEAVRPYLRSWYEAVRWDPRAAALSPEMTPAADIQESAPEAPVERAPEADIQESAPAAPVGPEQVILRELRAGEKLDKRRIQQLLQPKLDAKALEEAIELAIVMRAREIVASGQSESDTFMALQRLYNQQPNLSTRTSTSVEQQAYSTPAPLAYLASRLADIGRHDTVLEPTAGNGMLLMEVTSPKLAAVNELNPARADALRKLGFNPRQEDAATAKLRHAGYPVNVVIANPPFGTVRTPSGIARSFAAPLPDGKSFQTNEIDHAISMNALQHMHPKGRAVLIIGSVNKQAQGIARSDAYNGAAKRQFFYHLYQHYNVTDHFTVDGKLYAKQGAAWPVDVIVIEGRGRSALKLPAAAVPRQYDSWEALRGLLEKGEAHGLATDGGVVAEQDAGGDSAGVDTDQQPDEAGPGRVPVGAEQPAAETAVEPAGPAISSAEPGEPAGGRGPVGGRGSATGGSRQSPGAQQSPDVGPAGAARAGSEQSAAESERDGGSAAADQGGPAGSSERARELAGSLDAAALSGHQVPYKPASTVGAIGTLVPTNMRDATANALAALEARVGKLETYVAQQLGWDEADVGKFLGAEQVDGVALALDQISQGKALVIGDQTGVGKGRQVASAIRFALRQGMVPIFVTEKPNLYADIYRDLVDIGQEDIRPLVTNAGLNLPLDDAETVFLKTPTGSAHNKTLSSVLNTGDLGDHNMVFTTYNQMQTVKGETTTRMDMLGALGPRAMLILDESHNAGGQLVTDRGKKSEDVEWVGEKTGRAGFVRSLVGSAKAVVYSSATWAKRPDVMDLYSKTDMAMAVDKLSQLSAAITRGGVPLQQAVSAMLAKAGQYIRREKSFDGIEYNTPVVPVDLEAAEALSSVMLAVREFDTAKAGAVEALKEAAKAEARLISESNSTGGAGAQSTNFTSVMHNLIDQMLLALKADAAVKRALERKAEGKKVVITVSNTMGSFIGEYASEAGLKPGDQIALSFADLMMRYLEKSREVLIKGPDGTTTRRRLTDSELGTYGRAKYQAAKDLIQSSDLIGRLPVSPIDYMHAKLQAAGVKSAEITGRREMIDYTGAFPTYRVRPADQIKPEGRKRTINAFNAGTTDMLILNQAGATGLSLHASSKFKDKTQRWMVLAQAEKNIDTHMQMLGRINRTGQVETPGYDQLTADIPAEKRPAAVLAKKMASLNANTTAARDSAVTSKETVDFLNVYGDEVVAQLMEDMPDVHEKLGEPLERAQSGDGYSREDAARKVTGRIPLLPVAEQEALYEQIETGYKAALQQADAMGENALEAKTLDLDARPVARTVLFEGKGGSSPFAQGAWLEEVNVKRLGKPYTSEQVRGMVAEALQMASDAPWENLRREGVKRGQHDAAGVIREAGQFRDGLNAKLMTMDIKESEKEGRLKQFEGLLMRWTDIRNRLSIGSTYRLAAGETVVYGVLTKITRKKGVKLPVALGSWEAHFALADASRHITLPFSRLAASQGGLGEVGKVEFRHASKTDLTEKPIIQAFDDGQLQSREDRVIVTGNLLAGFAKVKGGAIVNFTTNTGEVRQGVLMPRSFDIKEFSEEQPVELTAAQVLPFFREASRAIVETPDGALTIRRAGADYYVSVPKSKADGGKYFLDRGLTDITRDFSSRGDRMIATISTAELAPALRYLESRGTKFLTKAYTLEARAVGGTQLASSGRQKAGAKGYDDGPMADLGDRPRTSTDSVKAGQALRAALDAKFGPSSIKSLIDKGLLRIVASYDTLPEGVRRRLLKSQKGNEAVARKTRGLFDVETGVVYLIGDRVSPASAAQILLHEIGEHYGLKRMLGKDAYHRLQRDVVNLRALDKQIGAAWDKVKRNYPNETEGSERFLSEVIARLADDTKVLDASWFKRAVWAVRRFLWSFGLFKIDAEDIRAMLASSLRAAMQAPEVVPRGGAVAAPSGAVVAPQQESAPQLNVDEDPADQAQRIVREGLLRMPVDRLFRTIVMSPLGRYQNGRFVPWSPVDVAVKAVLDSAKQFSSNAFEWLRPSIQSAARATTDLIRNALVDRAGTPEAFKVREAQKEGEIRASLRQIQELGAKLMETVTDENEKLALQQAMLGEEIGDEQIKAVAAPIIDAIEDMGRQLVELGFLTRETWEKNRRKYLHRNYLRHETAFAGGLTRAIDRMVTKRAANRRVRIIGDTFRGRGIFKRVSIESLKRAVGPDFWGSRFEKDKIDVALKNTEWVILDQVVSREPDEQRQLLQGQSGRPDRRVRRVYWPADEAIPNRYAGWENRGTFKVRDVGTGEVVLHRDYTKEERLRIGEIMDARYNIVKTMSLMTRDLATGKFFKDIAMNPEWARDEAPDGSDIDAQTSTWGRTWQRTPAWVKVPTTRVGGSTGPYRYGQLAGKYVQGAIWRDIAEQEAFMTPGVWRTLLRTWKISKTVLSPIVHINNIVSNFFLMDLQDVSFGDLKDGIVSRLSLDKDYQDALDHGLFGNNALDRDIQKQILTPILKEIEAANFVGPTARIKLITKVVDTLFGAGKWAVDKAGFVYQLEDELFRMATYKKLLADGVPAFEAAQQARRAFIDYDIRAPGINMLRRSVMPFISYTYRAIPLVAGAVAKRPWKLAKYYTIAYALQSLVYWWMDEEDEDKEAYERLMDDQYQGNVWLGVPRMLRLPANDQYGNPMFLDIRRWVPAGDVFESGQAIEWMPSWLQISGPILIGIEAALNINTFKDDQIFNDRTDTATEKATKAAAFVWAGMVPNFALVPGSYAQKDILAALGKSGESTYNVAGEKRSLGGAIAGGIGVKVRPLSLEGREEQIRAQYGAIIRDLRQQLGGLRSQMIRGNLSEEDYLLRSGVLEMKIRDAEAKEIEKLTGNRPPQ